MNHRANAQLQRLLWDARAQLQTAEATADAHHSYGLSHDLEQMIYELDILIITVNAWEPRRRAPQATETPERSRSEQSQHQ